MYLNEVLSTLMVNDILMSFVGFFTTLLLIPIIVIFSWKYDLVYVPNNRTSHSYPTPALGGIAIFFGLLVPMIFLTKSEIQDSYAIFAGIVCIFITGVLDDILTLSALRKLLIIFLLALIIVTIGDIRLQSLHNFLGIGELPYWVSIVLSIVLISYTINAVNLIDGIDGNAAITGIVALSVFDLLFLKLHQTWIIAITLPVILTFLAFLIYNLWGKNYKIFMGDTGSLILGFVIAITIIEFCNLNAGGKYQGRLYSPLTVMSLLIVPLFDQLHVFTKRILLGRSPFKPDRNHLHHTWLKLGFTHKQTSLIMLGYGAVFFVLNTFALIQLPVALHISSLFVMAILFWHLPEYILKKNPRRFVRARFNYEKKQLKSLQDKSGNDKILKQPFEKMAS